MIRRFLLDTSDYERILFLAFRSVRLGLMNVPLARNEEGISGASDFSPLFRLRIGRIRNVVSLCVRMDGAKHWEKLDFSSFLSCY